MPRGMKKKNECPKMDKNLRNEILGSPKIIRLMKLWHIKTMPPSQANSNINCCQHSETGITTSPFDPLGSNQVIAGFCESFSSQHSSFR